MRFEKLMAMMRDQVNSKAFSDRGYEGNTYRRDGQLLTPSGKLVSYMFQNHVKLMSPLDSKALFKACLEGYDDGEIEHVIS